VSVPRGWRTTTSRRFRRVWSAHPSRSVLHMCAYAHRHATAPRSENGIPQFQSCCCETHKRAHSPNPQARGPLSQCDGVFSICDENGRVSIATRMEYGRAFTAGAGLWCLTIPRYLICTSHAYLPDCYSLTFIKRAPCTALAPPGRLGPGERF